MVDTILKNFPIKITAFKSFYDEKNYSVNIGEFILRKRIELKDGHSFSVQASSSAYCFPRISNHKYYTKVEIGYPDFDSKVLKPFAEDMDNLQSTVYGYTPIELVIYTILEHGGLKE